MLTELRIKNFAIIESLTLPLSAGFNVLSGETGAGKSIIVGALGFLLGERGSSDLIRTGSDKATVEGVFDTSHLESLSAMADERGIDLEDDVLVLKREISSGGRGRAWANGSPVTATVLGEIGRVLVNLHGQHEAQALLDGESQRSILDEFGGAASQASVVRAAHTELSALHRGVSSLTMRRAEAERRADYLRHVVREIEDAKPVAGEDTKLEDEARVLENADELKTIAESVSAVLSDEEGALDRLASVNRSLGSIQRIDPSGARLQELFDAGFYALDELARAVSDYANGVDLDPERLASVRRRREVLYTLIKKYGPALEDVIEMGRKSRAELDLVDSAAFDIAQLSTREAAARERLATEAKKLTTLRVAAAKKLAKAVDALLPELGMIGGKFSVVLVPKEASDERGGAEDVEFRVALNVGHDARPLARVASGGELSRVMLALKTILARADEVPTLVFDEVDSGIGGKVGLQVGDTLRRVAEHHQVFAISHLPQIAARAHNHIVVAKAAKGGVTTADVAVLDGSTRVQEIARMLGGDPDSKLSRAHAKELLESAASA